MKAAILFAALLVLITAGLSASGATSMPINAQEFSNFSPERVLGGSQPESPPILIWFGASQTGKSSSIKLLTGDSSIICGALGRGESTTSEIKIYKEIWPKIGRPYLHMDTIGFGDTRLNLTDADIRRKIEMEILRVLNKGSVIQIKAIILTESLYGDSQQLSKNLLQISKIMGYLPSESIVVLGTKWSSIVYEQMIAEREAQILQVMAKFNISTDNYLRFSTPFKYLKESCIDPTQFSKLGLIIERCAPVQMQSIREKQERIRELTVALQKKNAKSVEVEVTEDRVEYSNKKEVYTHYIPYEYESCLLFGLFCSMNQDHISEVRERDLKIPYTVSQVVMKNATVEAEYGISYQQALQEFEQERLRQMLRL